MDETDPEWERRMAGLWASIDEHPDEAQFRARVAELAGELPEGSAVAAYERGSAFDSTGHSDRAVPLYPEALERALAPDRRRHAVIQLASSLRNVGQAAESAELLAAERDRGSDELDDALAGFLALALGALAGHLDRYSRSLTNSAAELAEPPTGD